MLTFLGYLALTLLVMWCAWKSGRDDLEDLAGVLFMSWIATNLIWTMFPERIIPLMPAFHLIMFCACAFFAQHDGHSKWSAWVAAGFVAMFINHAVGTPGENPYHVTQNLLFTFQCLVVLRGATVSDNKKIGFHRWTTSPQHSYHK